MLAPSSNFISPARYHHVSVMSECDAECTLCSTLGCLRPTKITSPELQTELDLAQRALKTAVVFPPNLLQHPEAAQFVTEVVQRGLKAIVRLRPEQIAVYSELIATLTYRDADFEVIVSQPLTDKVLNPRRGRQAPNFKTVFVPTRAYDPVLLFDSLPFSWRRSIEVLSCLPESQEQALTPDELFLMMKSLGHRALPYVEMDRRLSGSVPGANLADPLRFSFISKGSLETEIDLSVIVAVDDTNPVFKATLEALKHQSLPSSKFEICFAFDGVNDEKAERLADWSRASGLNVRAFELARGWTEPSSRKSQCWNLAISHARGSRILVLQSDLLSHVADDVQQGFLAVCLTTLRSHRIQKYVDARSVNSSISLTLGHYFDLGGFAEALQEPGCEIEFLIWKSVQQGFAANENVLNKSSGEHSKPALSRRARSARAQSAQRFYVCTLNAQVFKSHYVWLGGSYMLRRAFSVIAQSSLTATFKAFARTFGSKLEAAAMSRRLRESPSQRRLS